MANGIMTHNCSPEHKCHGIVDLLTLHWDGNSMNVWIDEIKTHPNKDNGSHERV